MKNECRCGAILPTVKNSEVPFQYCSVECKQKDMGVNMQDQVTLIIDFLEDNGIEIISYGLAPNPFGFCFEQIDNPPSDTVDDYSTNASILSNMLDGLSKGQELRLKKILFY